MNLFFSKIWEDYPKEMWGYSSDFHLNKVDQEIETLDKGMEVSLIYLQESRLLDQAPFTTLKVRGFLNLLHLSSYQPSFHCSWFSWLNDFVKWNAFILMKCQNGFYALNVNLTELSFPWRVLTEYSYVFSHFIRDY